MTRSRWTRLRLPMVLMFAVVACSTGAPEDPKDQLTEALRAMRADGGTVIEVSLATDDASIQALQADAEDPLPAEAARVLKAGSLRISMPLSPDATSGAVAFRVGDEDLLEIRTVDKVFYARADVPRLLETAGQDPAMADGFRQMLASGGMLPADAIDGRWLKLTGAEQAMQGLIGMGAGAHGGESPAGDAAAAPQLDQAKLHAAGARLAGVLADASTVERLGTESEGDHLRATVPLREAYAAIRAEADALFPGAEAEQPPIEEIPDEHVSFDIWIRDGRVSVAEFDLRQVAALDEEADIPAGVTRLALRAEFTPFDGVIEVPADAIELDVPALMQGMFMGMAMGGSMGGMGGMTEYSLPPGFDPNMLPPGYPQPTPSS